MYAKYILFAVLLGFCIQNAHSQCELSEEEQVCVDVNLSLGEDCMGELLAEMVIPALDMMPMNCSDLYEITITQGNGEEVENEFGMDDLHKTFHYEIEYEDIGFVCIGKFTVEYKLNPSLDCIPDVTVSCFSLDAFEGPMADPDECSEVIVRVIDEDVDYMDCDENAKAVITRTFLAINEHGLTSDPCEVEIELERFDIEEDIDWPDDVTIYDLVGDQCNDEDVYHPDNTGVPKTIEGFDDLDEPICLYPVPNSYCDILIEYEDLVTSFKNCKIEITRMWRAYEWHCDDEFMATHIQTIEIKDSVGPVIVCDIPPVVAMAETDQCYAIVELPLIEAEDNCNEIAEIDLNYPGGFIDDLQGDTTVHLPVGEYIASYRVYDGCFNVSLCDITVTVLDTIQPLVICKGPTVIDMEEQMEMLVDAEFFNLWSLDNCEIDSFAVARMEDNCDPEDLMFGEDVLFCCNDADTVVMVILQVVDTSGNFNQCMIPVTIENEDCPPLLQSDVSGFILNPAGELLKSAEVVLDGADRDQFITGEDGFFEFTGLFQNEEYALGVTKNDHKLAGISTLDLLVIQRHILGLKYIEDPYLKVAADINSDGMISPADILELRILILGLDADFKNMKSWTFVLGDYEFLEQRSAFIDNYPSEYQIVNLQGDLTVDFIGIKKGDVTRDPAANGKNLPGPEIRSGKEIRLEYIVMGEFVKVNVLTEFQGSLEGMQLAFDHPGGQLVNSHFNLWSFDDSNISGSSGEMTALSWHNAMGQEVIPGQLLFSLVYKTFSRDPENFSLGFHSAGLNPEVYLDRDAPYDLKIVGGENGYAPSYFHIVSCMPNPWKETSQFKLYAPNKGDLNIRVMDPLGRKVAESQIALQTGHNDYELNRSAVPKAGVYHVELVFEGKQYVQKILVID